MKTIIMKVHIHDGSTRVTIPKEIITQRGWENAEYFTFVFDDAGMIGLQPITENDAISLEALRNHGHISVTKN